MINQVPEVKLYLTIKWTKIAEITDDNAQQSDLYDGSV